VIIGENSYDEDWIQKEKKKDKNREKKRDQKKRKRMNGVKPYRQKCDVSALSQFCSYSFCVNVVLHSKMFDYEQNFTGPKGQSSLDILLLLVLHKEAIVYLDSLLRCRYSLTKSQIYKTSEYGQVCPGISGPVTVP